MSNNNDNSTQKKSGGCGKAIGIGCLTVFLLLSVGGFFAYRSVKTIIVKLADKYTEATPMTLPIVEISDQELAALFARVDSFSKSVKAGESAGQELTLTAHDINALIQKNPAWAAVAGKVYINIEDDCIHGDASIPLDSLGQSFSGATFLKGRWLNGSGSFRVETVAGRLLVFMDSLTVRNKVLPEDFMAGIRTKNLAEQATKNPETAALIQKLESIKISDNKLHITGK